MARFITGNAFGATDTVTSTTLNNAVNNAKISTDSVDGSTIEVNSDALRLKDAGITTAKIADSSSKTTGVTFAKMQHISTAQVLGRLSASEGDVEEVGVVIGDSGDAGVLFDNDDMLDNSDTAGGSATRGATQQSIKAYADAAPKAQMKVNNVAGASVASDTESVTLPNGLIMKFGIVNAATSGTSVSFDDDFPNGVIAAYACPNNGATLTQSSGYSGKAAVDSLTTSGMNVSCDGSAYWQAIGR